MAERVEPTPNSRSDLRRLVSLLIARPLLPLVSIFLLLCSGIAVAFGPRILGLIVDRALLPRDQTALVIWALVFLAVELLRLASSACHTYVLAKLGQQILHDLRIKIFSHVLSLPMRTLDRTRAGDLLTYMTNDLTALSEMFTTGFVTVLEKIVVVLATITALVLLDAKLALVALGLFALLFFTGILLSRVLHRAYRELRVATAAFNAQLSESILGARVIKLFDWYDSRGAKIEDSIDKLAAAQFAPVNVYSFFHPTVTLVNGGSIALLMYVGGGMIERGEISLGTLVAFFSYVLWLFWPVIVIVDRWNIFMSGMSAARRIFDLLSWPSECLTDGDSSSVSAGLCPPSPANLPSAARDHVGEIIFRGVWFAYEEERWVLEDVSFTIRAGERVAICGPTGSGKTTIISLLLRFYEPQRGSILLDGRDLRSYELGELRRRFGLVQQDATLFRATRDENITLFSRDFDETQITEALGSLAALLPEGGAQIGEALSMGEKQALAFARTVYRRPQIWILDEATAHLDPVLDRTLEDALARKAGSATLIVIAHRLSSLAIAQRILVLNRGKLIEEGSSAELLRQNGFYARLCAVEDTLLSVRESYE